MDAPRIVSHSSRTDAVKPLRHWGRCAQIARSRGSLCRLRARQRPDELAYRLLLLLTPNLGKIASDLEQHPLVRYDLARTFATQTFVKIGERHAQRAGNLK